MQTDRLALICVLATGVTACGDATSPRGPRQTAATSIVAGDISTCALTSAGAAYCWGADSLWQLGIGEPRGAPHPTPVLVSGTHTFAALSGGGELMCGLTSSGQAWCWGGEVGGPPTLFFHDSVPGLIGGSVSFVKLSSGPFHACGLTSGGDAYCWGQNSYGQLGSGDTLAATTPVLVQGGLKWSALSVGFWHTCALTTSRKPYCWGYPGLGSLGNPSADSSATQTTPLAVAGGLTLASINAGTLYSCGVSTTGAGYCWGANIVGQLGDGTDSLRDAPHPVIMPPGLTFSTMALSRANDLLGTTCAVASNGAAYCWGAGGNGQLGNPPIQRSLTPEAVSGGLTFSALAVGGLHVCGIASDGAIDCWGGNASGQLGDGTTQDRSAPTPVVGGLRAP